MTSWDKIHSQTQMRKIKCCRYRFALGNCKCELAITRWTRSSHTYANQILISITGLFQPFNFARQSTHVVNIEKLYLINLIVVDQCRYFSNQIPIA